MHMSFWSQRRWMPVVGWLLALAGCSSDGAADLAVKPQPLAIRDEQPIRLPQDVPFAIALSSFQKQEGPGGSIAEQIAQAAPDGSAEVAARVEQAARASGSFQLGHAFRNDAARQIDLGLRVAFEHSSRCGYADARQQSSELSATLTLIARDSYNRVIRTLPVVAQSTEQGGAQRSGRESLELTITLAPGESAQVFLAGAIAIDTLKSERSGAAAVKVSSLSIEATPRMAPQVQAAPNATRGEAGNAAE